MKQEEQLPTIMTLQLELQSLQKARTAKEEEAKAKGQQVELNGDLTLLIHIVGSLLQIVDTMIKEK
jgi:hypothetical protein